MTTKTEVDTNPQQQQQQQQQPASARRASTPRDDAIELEERNVGTPHNDEYEIQVMTPAQQDETAQPYVPNFATIEDIPPDGGYGWVVTFCVFVANAHTWGINASWGVFLNHFLTEDSYPGASKFLYALIGGLSISQALVIAPLVIASHGRLGPRITMVIGALIIFAALCAAGSTTEIWQLIVTQGFVFGWGMGFIYLPATEVLPHWFSRNRSLAVGVATSGAGLGGLAYSLLTGYLIQKSGVVWTYRILSFCALAMNLLSASLLRQRPVSAQAKRARSKAFNPRHFGRVEILLIVLWGFVTELGYITLLYSLPTYATSIGLDAIQGSVVQAMLNLGLGIGRPVVGYYSDRIGRINIAMGTTAVCAVFVFALWVPAHSYGILLAFALLAGTVCGTFWSTISPVLAEVVGLVELGGVMGSILFALVLPTTFAEAIAIQLVDGKGKGFGAFVSGQVFVGCMFVVGALSLLGLRTWKIADKEMKGELAARREEMHGAGGSMSGLVTPGGYAGGVTPSAGPSVATTGQATPNLVSAADAITAAAEARADSTNNSNDNKGHDRSNDNEDGTTSAYTPQQPGAGHAVSADVPQGYGAARRRVSMAAAQGAVGRVGPGGFWMTPRRAFRLERV